LQEEGRSRERFPREQGSKPEEKRKEKTLKFLHERRKERREAYTRAKSSPGPAAALKKEVREITREKLQNVNPIRKGGRGEGDALTLRKKGDRNGRDAIGAHKLRKGSDHGGRKLDPVRARGKEPEGKEVQGKKTRKRRTAGSLPAPGKAAKREKDRAVRPISSGGGQRRGHGEKSRLDEVGRLGRRRAKQGKKPVLARNGSFAETEAGNCRAAGNEKREGTSRLKFDTGGGAVGGSWERKQKDWADRGAGGKQQSALLKRDGVPSGVHKESLGLEKRPVALRRCLSAAGHAIEFRLRF